MYYLLDKMRDRGIFTYDARNQGIDYDMSFLSGILIIRIPFLYQKICKEIRQDQEHIPIFSIKS